MASNDRLADCAAALWALTGRWQAASEAQPSTLSATREALARLYFAVDGAGFPEPAADRAAETGDSAWPDCVEAALQARGSGPAPAAPDGSHALLWSADPDKPDQPSRAPDPGLRWPFAPAAKVCKVYGPFRDDAGAIRCLYFYATIDTVAALKEDGDARPGLWPRQARKPAPAAGQAKGQLVWAWALFVAAIVIGIGTALWIWAITDFARGTAVSFVAEAQGQAAPSPAATPPLAAGGTTQTAAAGTTPPPAVPAASGAQPVAASCLPGEAQPGPARWTRECGAKWRELWMRQQPKDAKGVWGQIRSLFWGWSQPATNGQISLNVPLLAMMAALLLLALAGGCAKNGFWFGVLIDERNRMSLSRAQQVCWLVLLLGGIAVLSVFNGGLLAAALRDFAAKGNPIPDTIRFFPSMDGALWAALGISVVASPWLSAVILDRKAATQAVDLAAPRTVKPDPLHTRASPNQASLADLFTGETEADVGTVDISRLQHLAITGMLLFQYFLLLASYLGNIDGGLILSALDLVHAPPSLTTPSPACLRSMRPSSRCWS
ncbi:MAG: hypothetical protein U1E53_29760 [Dongiaceae bacterium]